MLLLLCSDNKISHWLHWVRIRVMWASTQSPGVVIQGQEKAHRENMNTVIIQHCTYSLSLQMTSTADVVSVCFVTSMDVSSSLFLSVFLNLFSNDLHWPFLSFCFGFVLFSVWLNLIAPTLVLKVNNSYQSSPGHPFYVPSLVCFSEIRCAEQHMVSTSCLNQRYRELHKISFFLAIAFLTVPNI